jgi:hypothetical protein
MSLRRIDFQQPRELTWRDVADLLNGSGVTDVNVLGEATRSAVALWEAPKRSGLLVARKQLSAREASNPIWKYTEDPQQASVDAMERLGRKWGARIRR